MNRPLRGAWPLPAPPPMAVARPRHGRHDPAGARRPCGRGRCGPDHAGHRRTGHLQRQRQHVDHARDRAPGHQPHLRGRHDDRRQQLHRPPAARHPRAGGRPVQGRAGVLRQRPALGHLPQGRPGGAAFPGPAALRVPLRARAARDRLCAGGRAPHARVRHHARAAGRGGRGRTCLGPAQPRSLHARPADHRGRALGPPHRQPLERARLLPGDGRRGRHRAGTRRARPRPAAPPSTCWAMPRPSGTARSPACPT